MVVIVVRAVSPWVCIAMLNGLEIGEKVRKDSYSIVWGELV
jgi:hypothetical protein